MLKSEHGDQEMIKAHVNEMGIVMRFDSPADNLSSEAWESLLDELKSHSEFLPVREAASR